MLGWLYSLAEFPRKWRLSTPVINMLSFKLFMLCYECLSWSNEPGRLKMQDPTMTDLTLTDHKFVHFSYNFTLVTPVNDSRPCTQKLRADDSSDNDGEQATLPETTPSTPTPDTSPSPMPSAQYNKECSLLYCGQVRQWHLIRATFV